MSPEPTAKPAESNLGGDVNDEGYQEVGGNYVEQSPPPPAPYVQPSPFGEAEDEEE